MALISPRQLPALRAIVGGAGVTPFSLPDSAQRAQAREEKLRDELRAALAGGAPAREVMALEPLLSEYDGIEIAAVALRLLERAREQLRLTVPGLDNKLGVYRGLTTDPRGKRRPDRP